MQNTVRQISQITLSAALLFLVAFSSSVSAAPSVTLAWDPNPETNVTGYILRYGHATGVHTNAINVGKVTTNTVAGLVEGRTYFFVVVAYNNFQLESDPSNELSYTVPSNAPPTISQIGDRATSEDNTTGPISFLIGDADTLVSSLIVSASSSNPTLVPNGSILLGGSGTNRTLTVTPATNQFGSATITILVNDGKAAVSRSFVLTVSPVNDAPVISAISSKTTNKNAPTSAIPFTIGDLDTPASGLVVTASSSQPSLLPNNRIVVGGTGTNRTITLSPATNQTGTATITVTVSDGLTNQATSFVLTVTATNNPPIVFAPPAVSAAKEAATFVTGVSVYDADAGTGTLDLTLTVHYGRIWVLTTVSGGLTAGQVQSNGSATVRVMAPLAAMNATLARSNGVSYTGNLNFVGADALSLSVSDNGNTGLGGAMRSSNAVSITVSGTNFDIWRAAYFSLSDLASPAKEAAVWGDKADPDKDGRDNLLEFALGLDPVRRDPNQQPVASDIVEISGAKYAALSFVRRKNEPGLTYIPEVSSDKESWNSGNGYIHNLSATSLDANFEAVSFQDLTPITPANPRFFRLRVINN